MGILVRVLALMFLLTCFQISSDYKKIKKKKNKYTVIAEKQNKKNITKK